MAEHLAEILKTARLAAGLTQPQACEKAGVSIGTWSRLERSHLVPKPDLLARMAHTVGLTPGQLTAAGQDEAAELLAAMLAPPAGGRRGDPFTAVTEAQRTLLAAGWAVTLEPGGDGYTMHIRPPASS